MVDELDRVETLQRRQLHLELAQMLAHAQWNPKGLEGIERDLDREAKDEPLLTIDEAKHRAEKVVALAEYADRIERRKRSQSGGTGSP